MSREKLKSIVNDFSLRGFVSFFREKSTSFARLDDPLNQYDDDRFSDFYELGEIKFDDSIDRLVIIGAKANNELTDRSGKKAQYDKAKRILKDLNLYNAGIFIFYNDSNKFRFSLVYEQSIGTKRIFNNFRRFTYFVSQEFTNRTFLQQIGDGDFSSLDNIKDSFSVEKVNKEFYGKIAEFFYKLVGSEVEKGKYDRIMKLPVNENEHRIYQEFAVRLIGRIIFCWFLKYKKSPNNIPLIPNTILSSKAVLTDYYHSVLEKLFFEVLNTPQDQREKILTNSDNIPFLNGGLFEPHPHDFYNGNPLYSLTIPDNWFTELLWVLEQYNFTIDENSTVDVDISVDPEMLGRIFENLLAEINPDTGKTARKATGSYYTPRPIVEYMVDESIKQYLITKTNINEKSIASLLSYESLETDLNENEKDSVIKALDEIKVIDPACGSGAFPMGILQKMLLILQKVDPESKKWLGKQLARIDNEVLRHDIEAKLKNENWDYVHKLGIIQNSIYGVDIQPIAVDISKLRFFLSLIVDEKIDDDKPNRGVEPLPNLEFKFVSANSLIGLGDQPILETPGEFERLRELRNEYLNSRSENKKHIEEEFRAIQNRLFKRSLQFGGKDSPTSKISSWDPFSDEKSDWFDPEWMFGTKDGFDIVIANPPYIGEKNHKELFQEIKKSNLKEFYLGKMDYFYFFFHLAINMARQNGLIIFITTNYYITALGAKKLRQDFKNRTLIHNLVNFNELKIFESAAGQHNMITVLYKSKDKNIKARNCITKHNGIAKPDILQNILSWQDQETEYYAVSQIDLYDGEEHYIRLNGNPMQETQNPMQQVLLKIKQQGELLEKMCNVDAGLHPGVDRISEKIFNKYQQLDIKVGEGVFVLSPEESQAFFDRDYLKPLFKSSDIQKWCLMKNSYYILYSSPHKVIYDQLFIKHISKFKKILEDVRIVNNENTDNWKFLRRGVLNEKIYTDIPKIVAPYRSRGNRFAFNQSLCYGSQDVYFITEKNKTISLKYVLALLNSKPYYLWLYHRGKRKGEMLELYQQPLSEIPIKKISSDEQKTFIEIVDKILSITESNDYLTNPAKQAKVKEYEHQIDEMVYELYGLTPEEIAIVEGKK